MGSRARRGQVRWGSYGKTEKEEPSTRPITSRAADIAITWMRRTSSRRSTRTRTIDARRSAKAGSCSVECGKFRDAAGIHRGAVESGQDCFTDVTECKQHCQERD
eukprot:3171404-Pyramimonas_sp.AAC.1